MQALPALLAGSTQQDSSKTNATEQENQLQLGSLVVLSKQGTVKGYSKTHVKVLFTPSAEGLVREDIVIQFRYPSAHPTTVKRHSGRVSQKWYAAQARGYQQGLSSTFCMVRSSRKSLIIHFSMLFPAAAYHAHWHDQLPTAVKTATYSSHCVTHTLPLEGLVTYIWNFDARPKERPVIHHVCKAFSSIHAD